MTGKITSRFRKIGFLIILLSTNERVPGNFLALIVSRAASSFWELLNTIDCRYLCLFDQCRYLSLQGQANYSYSVASLSLQVDSLLTHPSQR